MAGNVTSEFGCSSYPGYGPGNGCAHFHNGIDIVAGSGCGAPIKAAGAGRIGYVGWNYADGGDPAWIVIIAHSQDLQTWYAHMKPTVPERDPGRCGGQGRPGHRLGGEHRPLDRLPSPLDGRLRRRIQEPAAVRLAVGVVPAACSPPSTQGRQHDPLTPRDRLIVPVLASAHETDDGGHPRRR